MRGRNILGVLFWPGLFTILGLAVLIGLGAWQLHRLAWKEALIRAVAERAHQPPAPLPPEAEWPRLAAAAEEYRRVRLSGTFRFRDEVHVFANLSRPRGPAGGPGHWVMTPLVLSSGAVILVNRGFVPQHLTDPAAPQQSRPVETVEIVGLLRWPEARNLFTPADDPAGDHWYTRDPQAIARAKGLGRVAPFYVDAEALPQGGLPQGGETVLAFPNRHLEYALTWFGLALALLAVAAAFLWRRLRDRSEA